MEPGKESSQVPASRGASVEPSEDGFAVKLNNNYTADIKVKVASTKTAKSNASECCGDCDFFTRANSVNV